MQGYVFEVDLKQTYLLSTTDINLGNSNIFIAYEFNQWTPSFGIHILSIIVSLAPLIPNTMVEALLLTLQENGPTMMAQQQEMS